MAFVRTCPPLGHALRHVVLAGALLPSHASLQEATPKAAQQTQAWRIESLVEDIDLAERAIFDLDFEPDGTLWLASSAGLCRYDGFAWRRFTQADGLPSDYVRCVCVLRDGALWVGTDRGACRFDGRQFDLAGSGPHLAGPSVRRIVEAPDGAVWFCCDRWPDPTVESGLTRLHQGAWHSFSKADGLPSDYVFNVFVDSKDEVFVLTRRGLAELRGGRLRTPLVEAGIEGAEDAFWSMVELPTGELLAASTHTYFRRDGAEWRRVSGALPDIRNPAIALTRDGTALTLATRNPARFVQWQGDGFVAASDPFPFVGKDVQAIAEAPDGSIWVVGTGLLIRWSRRGGEWSVYRDLPMPRFSDQHGGLWFAEDRRVKRLSGGQWQEFPGASSPLFSAGDAVWFTSGTTLMRWTPSGSVRYPKADLDVVSLHTICADGAGDTWIIARQADRQIVAIRLADGQRHRIVVPQRSTEQVQFAVADPTAGVWLVLHRTTPSRNRMVQVTAAGVLDVKLPDPARMMSTVRVFIDRKGRRWLYGLFGVYRMDADAGSWTRVDSITGRHVSHVAENGDELWFLHHGTTGGRGGLSRLRGDQWTYLAASVGTVLGKDRAGNPLFRSSQGVVRSVAGGSHSLALLPLPEPTRVINVVVDDQDTVWIGTREGVWSYRSDRQPPDTVVEDAPRELTLGQDYMVRVHGRARFGPRHRPLAHRIEGKLDDGPWRVLGSSAHATIRLPAPVLGRHVMLLRAIDEGLDVDPVPARLEFRVQPVALQSRIWFGPTVAVVFAIVLALAAFGLLARRRLRLQASDLEQTVQQRTEEVRRSEHRYRALFEESHDGILVLDLDWLVQDCNDAAERLFAMTRAELMASSLGELLDPDSSAAFFGRTPTEDSASMRLTRRDGKQSIQLSENVRRNEHGDAIGYQVIARDVTQQTRIDERLRHSQKMEAVGRMAGGVAHDFNNILTSILGYSELLATGVRHDPELSANAAIVLTQAQRAKNLTGKIQTFGRSGTTEARAVPLDDAIAGTEGLLQPLLRDGIDLRLRLNAESGRIRIDPGKLEQIVVNLVVNARDAMPEGGCLEIWTRGDDGWLTFGVTDRGCGMDEETRRKVFEPFFTTKPPGEGTGLGMAIVYGLIDEAGGSIDVRSRVGSGTTVAIRLPQCDEAPDTRIAPRPEAPTDDSGSILVVEDELEIRNLVQSVLTRVGYTVVLAQHGAGAIDKLTRATSPFDLVISDIVMPRMGGHELLAWIREHRPGLPVLFTTGHSRPHESEAPADAPILAKPFRPSELLRIVRQLREQRTK